MLNRSIELYAKIAKKINETIQPQDDKKHYINDTKNIIVGDTPKTFYYMYDNNQYYFTASNAKFSISPLGKITWYYGDWIDGFFRNGTWIDGTWHDGTFCRGNWLDGIWISGNWYKGKIDGSYSENHP